MTLWVYTEDRVLLWVFGLAWCLGFLGFWGPSMILTAEVYPTRIRGVGNGFSWSIAWLSCRCDGGCAGAITVMRDSSPW